MLAAPTCPATGAEQEGDYDFGADWDKEAGGSGANPFEQLGEAGGSDSDA